MAYWLYGIQKTMIVLQSTHQYWSIPDIFSKNIDNYKREQKSSFDKFFSKIATLEIKPPDEILPLIKISQTY